MRFALVSVFMETSVTNDNTLEIISTWYRYKFYVLTIIIMVAYSIIEVG